MNVDNRRVVGTWTGTAGTEMVWCVVDDGGHIAVEIDATDPMPAGARPCMPFARVRATPAELRELLRLAARVLEVVERHEANAGGGGPGYPGPCPDGVDWTDWLAMNNVD